MRIRSPHSRVDCAAPTPQLPLGRARRQRDAARSGGEQPDDQKRNPKSIRYCVRLAVPYEPPKSIHCSFTSPRTK